MAVKIAQLLAVAMLLSVAVTAMAAREDPPAATEAYKKGGHSYGGHGGDSWSKDSHNGDNHPKKSYGGDNHGKDSHNGGEYWSQESDGGDYWSNTGHGGDYGSNSGHGGDYGSNGGHGGDYGSNSGHGGDYSSHGGHGGHPAPHDYPQAPSGYSHVPSDSPYAPSNQWGNHDYPHKTCPDCPDCPYHLTRCPANGGTYQCVNTDTNRDFCGNCTTRCGDLQICYRGQCVCDPRPGIEECEPGVCVDTNTDETYCGSCETPCIGTCVNGMCMPYNCTSGCTPRPGFNILNDPMCCNGVECGGTTPYCDRGRCVSCISNGDSPNRERCDRTKPTNGGCCAPNCCTGDSSRPLGGKSGFCRGQGTCPR